MNTWASPSTSFPKGVISSFQRTLFLFINWISRQLGRSHTESKDTCHKTLLFLLTKRSCRTQEFCRTMPGYVLALLEDGHPWDVVSPLGWHPARRETTRRPILPLTLTHEKSTDLLIWKSRQTMEREWYKYKKSGSTTLTGNRTWKQYIRKNERSNNKPQGLSSLDSLQRYRYYIICANFSWIFFNSWKSE